jgi:hypothetical protein
MRSNPSVQHDGDSVDAARYADDLLGCLATLQPRCRLIWFFRVFYELPSGEISSHPRIQLEATHVDMLLQHACATIQRYLRKAGHRPTAIPTGVYARIWDASRSWGIAEEDRQE